LALNATPIVLECLYTPLVEYATPLAAELLAMRDCFLSKLAYQSYKAHADSQLKRLGQHLKETADPGWTLAAHRPPVLLAAVVSARERRVPVRIDEHRERILAVRDGRVSWKEFHAWRSRLMEEFEQAWVGSRLPDLPDRGRAERFLLRARKSVVEEGA